MTDPSITPTGMRIVRLLVGQPPKTLAALMQATGVTRTAVTEQLSTLLAHGYVDRTIQRSGRGRPHHLYHATEAAMQLFPTQEGKFVPALLDAVREVAGEAALAQALELVSARLSRHYQPQVTGETPRERLAQLVEVLRHEGVLVDLEQVGEHWVMHERSCPYATVLGPRREACEVERRMIGELIAAPLEMQGCRLDGCSGCSFKLLEAGTSP